MTDGDDDRLSDVDRRSMRILATSTKAAGPANARIAERLERAAGTGNPDDYRKAEASFDALPAIERRRIGSHAEKQAETQRQLEESRRRRGAEPEPVRRPAVDDTLDWKPLLLSHSPATDAPAGPAPAAARPARSERAGSGPAAVPPVPRPASPRPSAAPAPGRAASVPGRTPAGSGAAAATPPRKKPPVARQPGADARREDDQDPEKGWDWQRIPEDPVLKSTRRKPAALDPIEELRRQMLGDDGKRR